MTKVRPLDIVIMRPYYNSKNYSWSKQNDLMKTPTAELWIQCLKRSVMHQNSFRVNVYEIGGNTHVVILIMQNAHSLSSQIWQLDRRRNDRDFIEFAIIGRIIQCSYKRKPLPAFELILLLSKRLIAYSPLISNMAEE